MKKLFLLLVIILSNNAFGCDCPEPTIKEAYSYAQDVFIGEVISVDNSYNGKSGRKMSTIYKIRAIRPFKTGIGKNSEVITFYTDMGGCEYNFINGKKYIIYTDDTSSTFAHTNICLRTELLENVKKAELDELEILYNDILKQDNMDVFFPHTVTITKKEYQNLQKQAFLAERMSSKVIYLIITSTLLFLTIIILTILYINAKKKLNHP